MEKFLVAVPSSLPGGLDAAVSPHFGHCGVYTLLRVEGDCVYEVSTLSVLPHNAGDCMEPVASLAERGVSKLIAASIGQGPLHGCAKLGIEVFHSQGERSVASAVNDLLTGGLERYTSSVACAGCAH